ncbi:TauD/TfdA family dioxygenase [Psychrobacter sp. FDAARGOS_221]|uniref:TauD/TfdA family dioxygenase n=1 Tax=Psychrobacter sp. FDAARGOS_221 TaxID=1975705 RepID=UPI000BB594E6|nr:TauD/TfdA family dioxygenase [Psychrobacter sp. FDAARGOS_221]PNK59626.1 hypothetical protein A6J60_001170 [Psychrobacter sp. FDAARGOS_221]
MQTNIASPIQDCVAQDKSDVLAALENQGWILIRGHDYTVEHFSALMTSLCQTLTYDPARENINKETQKVDAGTHPVGLHIENGNTPLPPDVVAFFSELSASKGSQTTLCDGHAVYQALPETLKQLFSNPISISRYLPKTIWQNYVATAMGKPDIANQLTFDDLKNFIAQTNSESLTHDAEPQADGGIRYTLQVPAIRQDNLSHLPAFANTLLGPSFNYEKPEFTLANADKVDAELMQQLTQICEAHTQEIAWQDGDVLVLDNKRVMHGRREIKVPLNERKLYIGMGLGVNK